jgi:hypothetical protein
MLWGCGEFGGAYSYKIIYVSVYLVVGAQLISLVTRGTNFGTMTSKIGLSEHVQNKS